MVVNNYNYKAIFNNTKKRDKIIKTMSKKTNRPWGKFKIIHQEPGITIKIISVKPGQRLSLQYHKNRDEIWLLLKGSGFAELFDTIETMAPSTTQIIPREVNHRLSAGKEGCKVLEVSFGKFNEKDEVRYEDDYGRII